MREYELSNLEEAVMLIRELKAEVIDWERQQCLGFIEALLIDVREETELAIAAAQDREKTGKRPFPYELLQNFSSYDKPLTVTQTLRAFAALTGDRERQMIGASTVNKWLRSHGYIKKELIEDLGEEDWSSTEAGESVGIHAKRAEARGRSYMRITYDKWGQMFLADHFEQIEREMVFKVEEYAN